MSITAGGAASAFAMSWLFTMPPSLAPPSLPPTEVGGLLSDWPHAGIKMMDAT
jgi:hypothetical protein